jgi:hypothetical protein
MYAEDGLPPSTRLNFVSQFEGMMCFFRLRIVQGHYVE